MNRLLLDTHVWLWLANGDKSLTVSSRNLINKAAEEGEIYVSAISAWEISMLEVKGRITLKQPCSVWMEMALDVANLHMLPLSIPIAVESCRLPGHFHEDPADRIIVATARIEHLTLLTRDNRILQYSKTKRHLEAHKV